MKRQQITEGSILEINIENQYYVYAQILGKAGYAIFDYKVSEKLMNFDILQNCSILFIISVYNDVINQGHWLKVGKLPKREDLKVQPMQFIQDSIDKSKFRLYNPNTGEMTKATKEECKGLEVAAVYEAHHIEERIGDYYAGRMNLDRQKDLSIFNNV
jgi:Immunity protein 26